MGKLLLWGLLGSAFFSASFVLYQLMSVQGGHWFWSASLRCVFMWLLVSLLILLQHRGNPATLLALMRLFGQNWRFWCLTGGIGFGTYGLLAFAASYAAGWVIAATYLFTVIASLFIMTFFGQKFNKKIIIFSVIVFCGVVLANVGEGLRAPTELGHAATQAIRWQTMVLFGAIPAFLASFCFPIGNQLIWQASKPAMTQPTTTLSTREKLLSALPLIESPLLTHPLHKVWLMSLGSLPLWAVLTLIIAPPAPSASQIATSFLVALSAGVLGTSVFLYARGHAKNSQQLAAVDATQASEIIFALIGGVLLLHTPMPTALSWLGIMLVMGGLVAFARQGD